MPPFDPPPARRALRAPEAGALALSAALGAWWAHPVPVVAAALAAVGARAARRPWLLVLAVGLLASGSAARAWHALADVPAGERSGWASAVTDPEPVPGGVRLEVALGGRHLEVRASGTTAGALGRVAAGERVWLRVDVSGRPAPRWLQARHIAGRATVLDVGAIRSGPLWVRAANGVRTTLLRGVAHLSVERRSLFAGFVLGDDRDQPPEVVDDFRGAGLSHLLAVSGQNVALVLVVMAPLLQRFRLRGRFVATLGLLVVFGAMTRWEPSVLRAVAMAAIAAWASAVGRPASSARALALAVAGLLVADPFLVHRVGFLMSTGATAGLVLLSGPIARRVPGPRPVALGLGATLGAQLGVAPVQLAVFGSIPLVSPVANLIAVPIAGALVVWGTAAGLVAGVAGSPVAPVLHAPTGALVAAIATVARVATDLRLPALGPVELAGLALAGLAATGTHRAGRRLGVAALALAVSLLARPPGGVDGARLGDGARLWRAHGATVVVVDRPDAEALLEGLRLRRVGGIDLLVVARLTPSGAGELAPVLRRHGAAAVLAGAGATGWLPRLQTVEPGAAVEAGPFLLRFASGPAPSVDVQRPVAERPPV